MGLPSASFLSGLFRSRPLQPVCLWVTSTSGMSTGTRTAFQIAFFDPSMASRVKWKTTVQSRRKAKHSYQLTGEWVYKDWSNYTSQFTIWVLASICWLRFILVNSKWNLTWSPCVNIEGPKGLLTEIFLKCWAFDEITFKRLNFLKGKWNQPQIDKFCIIFVSLFVSIRPEIAAIIRPH